MSDNRRFLLGLCRAAGGAVIFALPLLMTMEMWWLGFTIDRGKLLLLVLILLPTLVALSYHVGFEPTFNWRDDLADAFVAYGVGVGASLVALVLLGVITADTAMSDAVGKITVQAVPASFGAMLGRTLLGGERVDQDRRPRETYGGELFIMAAGALFLSFSIAPTEEILQLAVRLAPWGTVLLALVSVGQMHVFVYAVEFHGQASRPGDATVAGEFLRLTVAGYALVLLICGYVLWTFGRTEGLDAFEVVRATVVLGFPASIGAAAARLIL
jgi:putative integral membrane protein (TIGR02587 family)